MTIKLYKVSDAKNVLDKTLDNTTKLDLSGTLRDRSDVVSPYILVQSNPMDYNYVYIEEFGRYYFINDIVNVRKNAWILNLSVDVLMTYNTEIKAMRGIVSRLTTGSAYAPRNLVAEDRETCRKIEFDYSFTDNGTYVLIGKGDVESGS